MSFIVPSKILPDVQVPNISTIPVVNNSIASIKKGVSQPATLITPLLPSLPLVPTSSVPPLITTPPSNPSTSSSVSDKQAEANNQTSATIQAEAAKGTAGCPLGASSATGAAAAVSGAGTQVNLAAIPNLSKTPSTSGQPGGWKAIDCRIGSAAAEAAVVSSLGQADTSSPTAAAASTQNMSTTDKNTAAKGAGCGGRRSKAQGIYSGSLAASPDVQAEWDKKVANLAAAGIKESDNLPPTNVSTDDWKTAVDGYMNKLT